MNGIHDMGGMHGFGPIEIEIDEPVFHEPWEGRVRAMTTLTPFNLDEFRMQIEEMQPQEYLRSSYFEKWLASTTRSWLRHGFITGEELEARIGYFRANSEATMPEWPGPNPALPPNEKYAPAGVRVPPRFSVGDEVVVRNEHPVGHTRRPRYVRGKRGVVTRVHGTEVFPDTNAHGLGPNPQPVYSVTFDARELWGASAEPNQKVSIDLWEGYLEDGHR